MFEFSQDSVSAITPGLIELAKISNSSYLDQSDWMFDRNRLGAG